MDAGVVPIELKPVWVKVTLNRFKQLHCPVPTKFNWDKPPGAFVRGRFYEPCYSARSVA